MKKLILLTLLFALTYTVKSQVKIIGHRGASYIAPENTMASAKLAWELGADAVEVDIYLTKDNRIICMHDGSTKRTTGQDYKVSSTSSKTLRKLDAGSFKDSKYKGEKIPFLFEILREIPAGKELVIEIKCERKVIPYLKKTIEKYGKNKKITFICFDLPIITETKKAFPASDCYWLCSKPEILKEEITGIRNAGLNGISLSNNIINEELMKEAGILNIEVFTWTVDDPVEAKRLISLGVKGITTNRPGWLNEQIF